MKQLEYRGMKSSTFKLVLFVFVVGTLMLVLGKISGSEWVTGVIGLVASYVIKDSVASMSEAYRDSKVPPPGTAP